MDTVVGFLNQPNTVKVKIQAVYVLQYTFFTPLSVVIDIFQILFMRPVGFGMWYEHYPVAYSHVCFTLLAAAAYCMLIHG